MQLTEKQKALLIIALDTHDMKLCHDRANDQHQMLFKDLWDAVNDADEVDDDCSIDTTDEDWAMQLVNSFADEGDVIDVYEACCNRLGFEPEDLTEETDFEEPTTFMSDVIRDSLATAPRFSSVDEAAMRRSPSVIFSEPPCDVERAS